MGLYPDCVIGLHKLEGKPYHTKVDPHVPPKKTPCRLVPINQQVVFKPKLTQMQAAGILKPAEHVTLWKNSFVNNMTSMVKHSCTHTWIHPTLAKRTIS